MSGEPGGFLRIKLRRITIWAIGLFSVGLLLTIASFRAWPLSLVAIVLMVRIDRATKGGRALDPTPWRKGLRGERQVAQALANLPPGFRAIHDLPTGRGNVDHVLVGPTGVFAIETKDWAGRFYAQRGRLMHNGRDASQAIAQATAEALAVKSALARSGIGIWVEAMVVSTRAMVHGGPLRISRVCVIDVAELARHVERAPARLSPEQVRQAEAAIGHMATTPR